MNPGKTILSQILNGLHPEEFRRCASQHPTLRQTHALSAYDHFAVMIFAQLTYRESLRDIEACLNARRGLLYHSGFRGNITRANLACVNEHRPAQLFASVAALLMRRARKLYAGAKDVFDLDGELFAMDSTLIDLSLAIFPWARWQGTQAAIKRNVVLAVAAYKRCWEIELFFRWIKQHLRLRGFYSNNRNGVAVQIWTSVRAHLLVAIAHRKQSLPGSLHRTLQIISISVLEKVPLHQLVVENDTNIPSVDIPIQLELNGF